MMHAFPRGLVAALVTAYAASAPLAAQDGDGVSPRIASLERQARGANRDDVVARFWEQMAAEGTPIVEPADEDGEYLVTFVFRGDAGTENVLLGGFGAPEISEQGLRQVPGTDVWYRTHRFRGTLRSSYYFMRNFDGLPDPADSVGMAKFMAGIRQDTLNQTPFGPYSSITLPDAPAQPWIEERDVPHGTLEAHEAFASEILGNERTIAVYLPPGYDAAGGPYPLIILFDGEAYTSLVPTPTVLDNLIAEAMIPSAIAVLIHNAPGVRNTELPCNERFADFLADELIPFVQTTYPVTRDPNHTVVGGSSYGGLASSCFAFWHPEIVGNVLSQSGSYWWAPGFVPGTETPESEVNWVARQYATNDRRPVRFFLEVGHFEWSKWMAPNMVNANRHLRDVLEAKGYEVVAYDEFYGGHDYIHWRGSIATGLVALFGAMGDL